MFFSRYSTKEKKAQEGLGKKNEGGGGGGEGEELKVNLLIRGSQVSEVCYCMFRRDCVQNAR